MKTASFLLVKFSMILSLSLFVILFPGGGCKSGTSVSNPFAKKPQPTDPKTPAAIDNVQITTPPEKYTKDTGSEKSNGEKSLAQKGKYEQYPGREKPETAKIAMGNSPVSNTYPTSGSTSLATQEGIPGFVSPASNPSSGNRSLSGAPNISSGQQYQNQSGNVPVNNYSGSNSLPNVNSVPSGNYPMAASASAPMGNYPMTNNPMTNNQASTYSSNPQGNAYPSMSMSNGNTGVYGTSNGNSSYSANNTYSNNNANTANNTYALNNTYPSQSNSISSNTSPNSMSMGNNLGGTSSGTSGNTFAPGSIGGF